MNKETKETLNKVAEYAEQDKTQLKKRMANSCGAALILLIFCTVLDVTNGFNGLIAERPFDNMMSFTIGLTMAILFMTILFLTGRFEKVQNWKRKLFHKN